MSEQQWVGLDVGGANLKAADVQGKTVSRAFPLWQSPERLSEAVAELLTPFNACDAIALTMTGELADCYFDRAEGVRRIIAATLRAAANRKVRIYSSRGVFLNPQQAADDVARVAGANWHATATMLATQYPDGRSLMIDIGSTTSDLIPLHAGAVASCGHDDFSRLTAGELVYVGAERTPLCAIVQTIPYRGRQVPIMREHFATIADCAVLLDLASRERQRSETADGCSGGYVACLNRMARMLGLEHRHFSVADAEIAAESIIATARSLIASAIEAFDPFDRWLILGHGNWLLPSPPCPAILLSENSGNAVARVGPAFAVAWLATQADAS